MQKELEELKLLRWRIDRFVDFTKSRHIDKEEAFQLDYFKNNDIFIKRQFIDSGFGLNESEYNKWLKNAKKQYFYTIPAASLITGSKSIEELKYKHSVDELSRPVLEGYTPSQILKTLNLLDIPTIILLTTKNVNMERKSCFERFISGTDGYNRIYSHFDSGSKIIGIAGQNYYSAMNANEFLFRKLRLPIAIILNSVNTAIDYFQLPDEGLSEVLINEKLCDDIKRIRKNEKYKEFVS